MNKLAIAKCGNIIDVIADNALYNKFEDVQCLCIILVAKEE